jgi:hypothetical protein
VSIFCSKKKKKKKKKKLVLSYLCYGHVHIYFMYRPVMIEKKLPDLIRKAKLAHHICYDVGAAALRDMGFDDYL